MANPEHLAKLKQGVEAWNAWRKEEPDTQPDLFEADLKGAKLPGIDFSQADLMRADLSEADLSGADMSRAKLEAADLSGVDASYATLEDADLSDANLTKADFTAAFMESAVLHGVAATEVNLSRAQLWNVDFSNANLNRAFLDKADMRQTYFIDTDLTDVRCRLTRWGSGKQATYFSSTKIAGTSFNSMAKPVWQVLKSNYNVASFLVFVVTTMLAFAPYIFGASTKDHQTWHAITTTFLAAFTVTHFIFTLKIDKLRRYQQETGITPTEMRYRALYKIHYYLMRWLFIPFVAAVVFKLSAVLATMGKG